MRYKISGIVYAPGTSSIKGLPTEVITDHVDPLAPDLPSLVMEDAAGQTGWAIDAYREIVPMQSPQDFGELLKDATDHGLLVMDNRGWSVMAAAIGVAVRDGQPNALFSQIVRLMAGGETQIELYPDGSINELSFGVLWYKTTPDTEGSRYVRRKDGINAKAYMVGGLIYRGPERGGSPNGDGTHEWSVHT